MTPSSLAKVLFSAFFQPSSSSLAPSAPEPPSLILPPLLLGTQRIRSRVDPRGLLGRPPRSIGVIDLHLGTPGRLDVVVRGEGGQRDKAEDVVVVLGVEDLGTEWLAGTAGTLGLKDGETVSGEASVQREIQGGGRKEGRT